MMNSMIIGVVSLVPMIIGMLTLEPLTTWTTMLSGLMRWELEETRFVDTRDETTHPIRHIGKVPLSMQSRNVKKKRVYVGQMV